jgi:hypothetical protein
VCGDASSLDVIFHPVKRKFRAKKLKKFLGHIRRNIRLKVQQIKIWLVIDLFPRAGG